MHIVSKQAGAWWQAGCLLAACVVLVLGSVTGLRRLGLPSKVSVFDTRTFQHGTDAELLWVTTDEQGGPKRLYDVRDGRPLTPANDNKPLQAKTD
ncbi:MAG: hypothetical protein J0I96_06270 [Rhodanobacter sp.]|nr:hypothetical protein [Rhodanobacter sp.]